jgi:phage terminase large subunit-like protein
MGLRGPGANRRVLAAEKPSTGKTRPPPWQKPGLRREQRVIAFLEALPITKGRLVGSRMRLLPGQRKFIVDVYGRPETRRVRLAVLSQPRGNGKTGLIAGLMLCHLLGPEAEPRGECYSAAIDRQQAGIIFAEMEAMIFAVPEFAERVNIRRWHKGIEVRAGDGIGSTFEALSADARRAHGLAPSFWAYDELAQARDRILLDNLTTAMGKRKRALGVVISTQAADDEHPLSQIIDDAVSGADPAVIAHVLSAPKEADAFDEATIRSVNPAFGSFLDASDVLGEAARAKRMPSFEPAFRNLRLNQRISTFDRVGLIKPEVWALGDEAIDEALFTSGRPVFGGLDLSARVDLTALVLAVEDDEGVVHVKPWIFTPQASIVERGERDRVPYETWARQGYLEAVPGVAIDYDWISYTLAEATAGMNLARVNFDRWRIEILRQALQRVDYWLPLAEFGQGFVSMSPAIEAFEELALEGRLRHGGHPVLRWCVSNVAIERDAAGNRKPTKAKSYGRIDAAVAALMAIAAAKASAEAPVDVSLMIA